MEQQDRRKEVLPLLKRDCIRELIFNEKWEQFKTIHSRHADIRDQHINPVILKNIQRQGRGSRFIDKKFLEHGMKNCLEGGMIRIRTDYQDGYFSFCVEDNGDGLKEDELMEFWFCGGRNPASRAWYFISIFSLLSSSTCEITWLYLL